ncbi:hypothetical protein GOP47_0020741 [Adiantum capillus-veneris]|uniref:RRM domain-containing protein n=1 Tax=Adiantum capillus-veneris TaxID=13818 RepID=A0A9D4U9Q3_ADICA|nr:hypothetical protein GOP47_0020741 [Adiantum capillus-veneris]
MLRDEIGARSNSLDSSCIRVMAGTVKVSNISSKATIKEIEEFFSFSGKIESVNLNSDEDESQTAYVTFTDQNSVKIALLLSGSAILDKEVTISPCYNTATAETETSSPLEPVEPAKSSFEAQGSIPTQARLGAINRAQEIVKSMLSGGFSLGKDAMKRENSLDEKSKNATDSDALKDLGNGSLDRRKSEDLKAGDNAHIPAGIVSNVDEGKDKDRAFDDVNDSTCNHTSATMGDSCDGGAHQAFQGGRRGSNNVRMGMQKCYKHVCAINEKLQIGQRTLSALATAQQGVANAGSAVANNKFVSAGGVWVNGALSRVALRNPNTSSHVNHDGGEGSPSQLTEMTTFVRPQE